MVTTRQMVAAGRKAIERAERRTEGLGSGVGFSSPLVPQIPRGGLAVEVTKFWVRIGDLYYVGWKGGDARLGPRQQAEVFYSIDEAMRLAAMIDGQVQGIIEH